jgi:hypothetical protein
MEDKEDEARLSAFEKADWFMDLESLQVSSKKKKHFTIRLFLSPKTQPFGKQAQKLSGTSSQWVLVNTCLRALARKLSNRLELTWLLALLLQEHLRLEKLLSLQLGMPSPKQVW